MSRASQRRKKEAIQGRQAAAAAAPSPPEWEIAFYQRDDESVPGLEWLRSAPKAVRTMMIATLESVRDAPQGEHTDGRISEQWGKPIRIAG